MTRDGSGADRLLARARRPAVNPWGRPSLLEVESGASPPLVPSVDSLVEPPRRDDRSTAEPTRTLQVGAGESGAKAAADATAAASPAPARPAPLRAVEPAPTGAGESRVVARLAAAQPWSLEPGIFPGADQDSGRVGEEAADSHVTAPAPSVPVSASAPALFEAPAERTAGRPQVPRTIASTSTAARRLADSPALVDGMSEATARQPVRRPAVAAPAATALAAYEAVARMGPEPDATAQPASRQSADSPLPAVVIDEIRIVTPAAASPAPDPLASLAAQRVGASRHRGGERWRA